ncbi:MAG TPA: hypothetical protein DCL73_15535 [Treponema sp.]|nr:hypothetical protein [Treponema sp.]
MKRISAFSVPAALCAIMLQSTGCTDNTTTKTITGGGYSYKQITIEEKNKYAEIKVQYPQFDGYADLNRTVDKTVVVPYKAFKSTVKQDWKEMDSIRRESGFAAATPPFSYDVGSGPVILNDRYISMLFTTYAMEGGAHGDTTLSSITYDREQNKIVSIIEAAGYTVEELSAYCSGYFMKNLDSGKGSKESEDECAKWIAEGTAPEKKNYEKFTYDGKTLTVYFEPYIVAPYVYGIQKVPIPAK